MESCSGVSNSENEVAVKDELNNDSKDDCVIVREGSHENKPLEVVYEISDDDEDDAIAEITPLKLSEPLPKIVTSTLNRRKMDEEASFVDLIDITNKDSNTICSLLLSLLTINQFTQRMDSVPSPVPKLYNSGDDFVKSRKILSRKRERSIDNPEEPVIKKRGKLARDVKFSMEDECECEVLDEVISVSSLVPLTRRSIAENGANIEAENRNTRTRLYDVIEKMKFEVTEFLLKHKASVRDNDGLSPLHLAADIDCLEIIEHLLKYGANINCSCTSTSISKGYAPLHCAVENGRKEVVKLLLSRGVNVDVKGEDGITPLHIAANKGYVSIAEDLLDRGACINSLTLKEGYMPLHFASEQGNEEAVKLFLDRNADINASTKGNLTPLSIATKEGHNTVVKLLLLSYKANINAQDKSGQTPIFYAIENSDSKITKLLLTNEANIKDNPELLNTAVNNECMEIVKALLQHGADVNGSDEDGRTALHFTAPSGHVRKTDENIRAEIAKLLLTKGANVDAQGKNGRTTLHWAVKKGYKEVVKVLLECGADVNASEECGRTALHFTAINYGYQTNENNRAEIAKLLLTKGANIDAQDINGETTLHRAVSHGYKGVVKILLEWGADVHSTTNELGKTALHFTTSFEYPDINDNIRGEIAEWLLTKGASVDAQDKKGRTTLHRAVQKGYKEVVRVLLEYDADVNVCNTIGQAALHFTAINDGFNQNNRTEIVKPLLTKGANVDAQDKNGKTTLHYAVKYCYKEVVKVLLEFGADVNVSDKDGRTALHFTALNYNGYYINRNIQGEIAKLLLSKGANVNAQTKNGTTTLHWLVEFHSKEVVKVLLECGSDVNATDQDGQTALHIASRGRRSEVVLTLLEYGSDINITSRNNHTALDLAMAGLETGEIVKALRYHIVKMKTANLYISEKNLQSLHGGTDEILGKFQEECDKEIASMNSEKISNTIISFYDILAKDTISLEMYMRNENTVQVFITEDYKIKFPIYASMIGSNLKKAMERKELLEQSYNIFHFLVNNLPELPYVCTKKIFSYLSNKDLQIFVNGCKPFSIRNPNSND